MFWIGPSRSCRPRGLLLLLGCLFLVFAPGSGANSFFNRDYSSLEETETIRGDFDEIIRLGKLRILVPQDFTSVTYLPRKRSPLAEQQRIAEAFAESHGLTPVLVLVKNFAELIPALQAGKGDIIVNNLTINEERLKKINFSIAVDHVREQVIVRAGDDRISRVRDLDGKTVMVNRDSTFWHALKWLRQNRYPGINLLAAPDHVKREQILDLLAKGDIDATILDSNLAEIFMAYRDDIQVAVNFSDQRDIGWGVRKDAPRLVSEINRYLQLEHASDSGENTHTDDFPGIKNRRSIRVLMPNSAASYFLYRGELQGFEYELMKEFARYHNLRLEVVVLRDREDFSTWLLEGRADLAMGFLETDPRRMTIGIAYSRPYHITRPHIVVPASSNVAELSDLGRLNIAARRGSGYWRVLSRLQRQGVDFGLLGVDDDIEIGQLLLAVAEGRYDATLVGEHVMKIEPASSLEVRSALTLDEEISHRIALRAYNTGLREALDRFIERTYRGEFYNLLYRKYFKDQRSVKKLARGRQTDTLRDGISPYDKLLRRYADRYGFDWRLIAAQMYEESGFDPGARSPAGARGLMQLMPRTAHSLGIRAFDQPENSILGGIKYLDWLRDRFDEVLPLSERLWFSLAAYNAGIGHVHDARRLAGQLGHDPDRWFDQTEKAMLLLARDEYAGKARYGYVNGRETVNYVRDIRQRFEAYIELGSRLPDQAGLRVLKPAARSGL